VGDALWKVHALHSYEAVSYNVARC
jgi:hypothetical protein